jgi:DNA recombination protein RmuC
MIDMQTFVLLLLLMAVFAGGIIFFLSNKLSRMQDNLQGDENQALMGWLKEMKTSVEKNSEVLDRELKDQRSSLEKQLNEQRKSMQDQTKMMWERLENSSKIIGKVQEQIGGIQEFGKDIKDLSNVLKSPKMRGGLGEQLLYEILSASLPKDLYKTQYKFKGGSTCDAVVKTEKGLIPIDSKFPMENFKLMLESETQELREKAKRTFVSDVKKRIDEISSKYILPEEGTTEQAIMYIPSENVYYELLVNTAEVEEYAKNKSVIMASPNTLNYFLKVLLVAYQQNELQQHAGEILKALSGIKIEAEKFEGDLSVLDRHLSNAGKSMETVRNKFGRLFGKIEGVQAIGQGEDEQKKLLE